MSTARTATRAALGLGALLLMTTACGAGGDPATDPSGPATHPTAPATDPTAPATGAPAPAADKGPQCEGTAPAHGLPALHVLINADAALPGGATVHYAAAHADGTHRTADLSTAAGTGSGSGTPQTVRPAQRITVGGHAYTVAQICTYRVVLTGPGLTSPADQGGTMTSRWPTTHDGRWRLLWHLPDSGPGQNSAVVTSILDGPPRTSINVVAGGRAAASYVDVTQGDTVEIAGRLWKIAAVDQGAMTADTGSSDFTPGYVDLQLIGPA
ncbi:hypothetical protein ACWERV_10750 [Streptomyces sp. NPDC004031]